MLSTAPSMPSPANCAFVCGGLTQVASPTSAEDIFSNDGTFPTIARIARRESSVFCAQTRRNAGLATE